jgi:hypothetical protein
MVAHDATGATTFSVTAQVDRLKAFRLKVLSGYFGYEGRKLRGIR